ncbi:hypothetical protein [Melissospora conviva]|uniref:hypothetical protein n=1 Tax=Melissospora conviva TaxID=3388432 RepID=UPI003B805111
MSEGRSRVAVMLCPSAVTAYVQGLMGAVEVIGEVVDDGAVCFGLADVALAEIAARAEEPDERALLYGLAEITACRLLGSAGDDPRELEWLLRLTGAPGRAVTAQLAMRHGCHVLTATPAVYGDFGLPVIPID